MNKPHFGTFRVWSEKDNKWVYGSFVHTESISMFTGLNDNNNTPLYVNIPLPDGSMSRGGDILSGDGYPYINKGQQNYVAIPSWNGDATYHVVGDVKGISHGLPVNEEINELKIIGNAYENPDLLEEKQ